MKNIDKKKLYMIIGIMLLILSLSGSAYAYFSAIAVDETTVSGTAAGGADLDLVVNKISTGANSDLIPLDNTTDMLTKAVIGYNNDSKENNKRCIDKNGYTVCQVYKITITNNGSIPVTLNGGVTLSGTNTPNIECAVMDNINTVTNNKSCKGDKTLANKVTLNGSASKDYYIIVYIKNINGVQTDSGGFNGTIFFNVNGDKIETSFEDSPAMTTLTSLGLSVDTTHTPNFNTVSGNSGVKMDGNTGDTLATGQGDNTNGIYEAEDDLGKSYYFRGNIENNYVSFAGFTWRIIRINGDGSIRMILDGRIVDNNGNAVTSAYNTNYNDNAYVGYMYGTTGSSTYNGTHANTNNSTIKGVIDSWYSTNLSSYSEYIADAIYCNDRQVVTNVSYTYEETLTFNGNGTGVNQTAYASLQRNHLGNASPTLKCTQKNDRFTVNDEIGNEALTYPIGLITTDEVIMAGGSAVNSDFTAIMNKNYYLYTNYWFWSMTPFVYVNPDNSAGGGNAFVDFVGDGFAGDVGSVVNLSNAVRPVVSLKSDAISGGSGTSSSPFLVG